MAGYQKRFGKIPPPNPFVEKNVVPFNLDLTQVPRRPVLHGEMEINGIRLSIDPSSISITEQNYNHTYQTLRTKESIKVRSGYARLSINVTAFFTGVNRQSIIEDNGDRRHSSLSTINSTLMPILYSLKKYPLCFVENELIRRGLPVSSYDLNWKDPETGRTHTYLTGENIGLFLNSVNVSTVEGMPETLQAQFSFTWYNHRPFAHSIKFRQEWLGTHYSLAPFINNYKLQNSTENANPKVNAVNNPKLASQDNNPENPSNHTGRQAFINMYGNPSVIFNATTKGNFTNNIHHSRPFLEWMWPYKYESTNSIGFKSVKKNFSPKDNPFYLSGFDRGLALEFTTFQHPQKMIIDGKEMSFDDILRDFNVGSTVEDAGHLSKNGAGNKTVTSIQGGVDRIKKKYDSFVRDSANRHGVPYEVLVSVLSVESKGIPDLTSSRGAQGLAQLVPDAQKDMGVKDPFDPAQSIEGGAKYIALMMRKSNGDIIEAVWRYHRGSSNVDAEQRVLAQLGLPTNYPQYIDASRASELTSTGKQLERDLKAFGNMRGVTLSGSPVNSNNGSIGNSPIYLDMFQAGYQYQTGAPFRTTNTASLSSGVQEIQSERARRVIDDYLENFNEEEWYEGQDETVQSLPNQPNQSIAVTTGPQSGVDPKYKKALEIKEILDRMAAQNTRIEKNFITGKVAEISTVILEVPQGNSGVIPLSISMGFGHSIVTTPLEGHRFPTAQYVGGQNTVVNLSIRCEGEEGRAFYSDLIAVQNASENGAISYREFAKKRPIVIYNPLINSMNIYEVFIEDVSVDTIPGSPDGLFLNIRLLDATLNNEGDPLLSRGAQGVVLEDAEIKMLSLLLQRGWIVKESILPNKPGDLSIKEKVFLGARLIAGVLSGNKSDSKEEVARDYFYSNKVVFREDSPPDRAPQIASHIRRFVETLNAETAMSVRVPNSSFSGLAGVEKYPAVFKDWEDGYLAPLSSPEGYNGLHLIGDRFFEPGAVVAIVGTPTRPGAVSKPIVKAALGNLLERLVGILGIAPEGGPPLDPDFAELALDLSSHLSFVAGHEAYPDLGLPPNPITGLVQDMTPDFFLYNESDIKFCKTPTLAILNGDISNTPKGKGLLKALYAIGSAHEGVQQVYGINPATDATEVGDVTLGPDKSYLLANRGEYTTVTEKQAYSSKLLATTPRTPIVEADLKTANISGPNIRTPKAENSLLFHGDKYDLGKARKFHSENRNEVPDTGAYKDSVNRLSHVYDKKEYQKIFTEFTENYQGDHLAIRRSFPTFKVFFIDEEGEVSANSDTKVEAKLFRKVALDDFYGVNAIKSIRIIEQKNMAASSCIIEVLDIDGILYNRKYLPEGSKFGARESNSRARRTPFSNTIIKEGMKVMVKFGYSNDPDQLETKFIGQIAQFEGNHLVEIICQSYGTELVAKKFGTDPGDNAAFWNAYTHEMLHDCMDRDELRHFGRWQLKDINALAAILPAKWIQRNKIRPDGQIKQVWSWKPSVVDDNIFAPDKEQYADAWAQFFGNINFVYWDTTIWDVFKECELRHPGYIAYPAFYGNTPVSARMTMFFGNPSMEYLSRPPSTITELEGEITQNNLNQLEIRQAVVNLGQKQLMPPPLPPPIGGMGRRPGTAAQYGQPTAGPNPPTTGGYWSVSPHRVATSKAVNASIEQKYLMGLEAISRGEYEDTADGIEHLRLVHPHARTILNEIYQSGGVDKDGRINKDKFWKSTMVFQKSRMKTFRNYELATSLTDIVANNIRCDHRDTFNSIELRYSNNSIDFNDFFADGQSETMTVNADDNIQEHHIRRGIESWINCTTDDLARRYASQLMANSLKRTYKGELILLGKPQLKPYDILWIHDAYSDIAGPIEIDEVVHSFSSETGFMTEVVPAMIVAVKEEVTTLLTDAVGTFFTETIGDFTDGLMVGSSVAGVAGLGRKIFFSRAKALASASKVEVQASRLLREQIRAQKFFAKRAATRLTKAQEAFAKSGLPGTITALEANAVAQAEKLALLKAKSANAIAEVNAKRALIAAELNSKATYGAPQVIGGAVGVGATIAAGTLAIDAATNEDDPGSRGSYGAGLATGIGASALFMWVPFVAAATAIGAGYAVFKFIKAGMTREPIIITPLLKQGKPFVTGIDGYESDGLVISDLFSMDQEVKNKALDKFIYKKWRYYGEGISDAFDLMEVGLANLRART